MAVACDRIRREAGLPIGVNVLANAALHALAVASAFRRALRSRQPMGQRLRRQRGVDRGRGGARLRYRRELGAHGVRVFADAHVKHGAHAIVQDRPVAELVRDVEFFNADAVIATGQRTGHAADLDYLRAIRAAATLPTLVGSGVTPDNVAAILAIVDGVIVASALKVGGGWWNPVDPERARPFVERARGARERKERSAMATRPLVLRRPARRGATTWDAALDHRFFREVAADTLADEVFARYLRIEYGFVDTAARSRLAMRSQRRRRSASGAISRSISTADDRSAASSSPRPSSASARPRINARACRRRAPRPRCTSSFSASRGRRATRRSSPVCWRRNGCT